MKGFINIGNTCYLNATLQMLINNQDICNLVIKYADKSLILNIISKYIFEYYNSNISLPITPIEIKKIIENYNIIFKGHEQHDASEVTLCLLNIINDEINKIDKVNKFESLFNIHFNLNIHCTKCLENYNKTEINNILILDIKSELNNLDDIYRNFKAKIILNDDNKYYCDKCKTKRLAIKNYTIKNWSNNLLILLKRFQYSGNNIIKNTQKIDIPLIWRHNYYLYGAIIHNGNINGGHYIYVGKQANKWYIYNDTSVNEIISNDKLNQLLANAYLLYYKQN